MRESEGLYRWFRFLKRVIVGLGITLIVMGFVGYAFFIREVDARGAWTIASREIAGGMLHYGERVERWVKAYQRRPADYYRAANGLLVATNDRIIFIGIAPPDQLATEDAPPTIIQYEFPNDTMLTLTRDRVFGFSRGVRIQHGDGPTIPVAAAPGEEAALNQLIAQASRRIEAEKAAAARERRIRAAVDDLVRQPIRYVIRRGDALSTIATRFDATPELLRQWNNLVTDRVRVGDTLLVKPAGPRQGPQAQAAAVLLDSAAARPAGDTLPSTP